MDGLVLVEGGRALTLDEATIIEEARAPGILTKTKLAALYDSPVLDESVSRAYGSVWAGGSRRGSRSARRRRWGAGAQVAARHSRAPQRTDVRAAFRGDSSMRQGSRRSLVLFSLLLLLVPVSVPTADFVATDPGPRSGPPGAGGPLPGLSESALQLFLAGQEAIQEINSVQGTIPDTELGLGPRFNMDSCGGCHSQPAPGGSSPPVNPQVAVATKQGATNTVPFFITSAGPIRHAHVKRHPNGTPDGRLAHLYTITGRVDAPGCVLEQPDFEALAATDNLAFHIPLQLFGLGLILAIDDTTILANLASQAALKQSLGIGGHPGGPFGGGRLGWKGQGSNLQLEVAGAYQGEVGVTSALIRRENDQTPGCLFNPIPEDAFDPNAPTLIDSLADVTKFTAFALSLAPPTPIPDTPSIARGRMLFAQIGCALCHTPSLQTGTAAIPALSGKMAHLYSDVALHRMGPGLADGVVAGNAGPDEFRTTPLWGIGQRIFLLHDGRTTDLLEAIDAHASQGDANYPPSEANAVIGAFNALSERQTQNILDFLRAL